MRWIDGLRFEALFRDTRIVLDGDGEAGPSPVAALLQSLASCAASDVVEILRKGRQDLRGLRVRATGERRGEPPRRFTRLWLEFAVEGPVDRRAAERAVRLSFEKYCSVFHTLRQDLELDYQVELVQEP